MANWWTGPVVRLPPPGRFYYGRHAQRFAPRQRALATVLIREKLGETQAQWNNFRLLPLKNMVTPTGRPQANNHNVLGWLTDPSATENDAGGRKHLATQVAPRATLRLRFQTGRRRLPGRLTMTRGPLSPARGRTIFPDLSGPVSSVAIWRARASRGGPGGIRQLSEQLSGQLSERPAGPTPQPKTGRDRIVIESTPDSFLTVLRKVEIHNFQPTRTVRTVFLDVGQSHVRAHDFGQPGSNCPYWRQCRIERMQDHPSKLERWMERFWKPRNRRFMRVWKGWKGRCDKSPYARTREGARTYVAQITFQSFQPFQINNDPNLNLMF